jgi:hypothetical protein
LTGHKADDDRFKDLIEYPDFELSKGDEDKKEK